MEGMNLAYRSSKGTGMRLSVTLGCFFSKTGMYSFIQLMPPDQSWYHQSNLTLDFGSGIFFPWAPNAQREQQQQYYQQHASKVLHKDLLDKNCCIHYTTAPM